VTLRNGGAGGQLVFDISRTHQGSARLDLDLPGDGSPIRFWVAGEFQHPSADFGDAVLEVAERNTATVLSSTPTMVRIRKDANTLSNSERDRFLAAFGTLNGQGTGRFKEFRDMHVSGIPLLESHGNKGFLPWHRAYLLDLERELQAIDASVALPYWRFDRAAPRVFTRDFMGIPGPTGRLQFVAGHPFNFWVGIGSTPGINRAMSFQPGNAPSGLINEVDTIGLGDSYDDFVVMEGDPHGLAHTRFGAPINNPATSPQDPLFFLLHANVDRLWAKWQWFFHHTSDSDPKAYATGGPFRIGHNFSDTMWPWNGLTGAPRPSTAPGGALASSALTSAPGSSPTVRIMIDHKGFGGGPQQGFDYDDVPYWPDPVVS
jgi:tyrosinase